MIDPPPYDLHFRQIDVSLDKANDLGDEYMLHEIRGSDNTCTDVVAYYFQYHMGSMTSYLTIRVHSQEKACPNTHTIPGNAVLMQVTSCLDEYLLGNGAIFFVPVLRNAFRKSLETHGVDHVKS